jgi:hypothetical protein
LTELDAGIYLAAILDPFSQRIVGWSASANYSDALKKLGAVDSATAQRLGEAWVGEGSTVASDGKTLLSADGLRQFRPP